MKRSVKKSISILVALTMMLSPWNTLYADQEHDCEQAEVIAEHVHEDNHDNPDHHHNKTGDLDKTPQESDCVSCIDKTCCCDSSSCSCIMVISFYVQMDNALNISSRFPDSSIPFSTVRHAQPELHPLLRPPII